MKKILMSFFLVVACADTPVFWEVSPRGSNLEVGDYASLRMAMQARSANSALFVFVSEDSSQGRSLGEQVVRIAQVPTVYYCRSDNPSRVENTVQMFQTLQLKNVRYVCDEEELEKAMAIRRLATSKGIECRPIVHSSLITPAETGTVFLGDDKAIREYINHLSDRQLTAVWKMLGDGPMPEAVAQARESLYGQLTALNQ